MIVVQPALRGQPPGYTVVPGGTSASAPLVAGAAALIRARFPQLKAPDVIQRLIRTADDAGPPGRDEQYGFGRLNLVRALTADVPAATANPLGEPTPSTSPVVAADRRLRAGNVITAAAVASGGCLLATLIAAGVVAFVVLRRRRTRPG
jgi:membrane-anchored mycosin MYCP